MNRTNRRARMRIPGRAIYDPAEQRVIYTPLTSSSTKKNPTDPFWRRLMPPRGWETTTRSGSRRSSRDTWRRRILRFAQVVVGRRKGG